MLMAGGADLVPCLLQSRRVGVVAVGATNPLSVHLALDERAVNVNLVEDLTVGMIRMLHEQFIGEVVVEVFTWPEIGMYDAASRMALGAGLDLDIGVAIL